MESLSIKRNCGKDKLTIWLNLDNNIQLGSMSLCRVSAIKYINEVYDGDDYKEYAQDVVDVFDGKSTELFSELKNDKEWYVRREVAKHGKFLEELKNDVHWIVRLEVAKQGKFLEELKNDVYWRVRKEVVIQGKFLEELKNDEYYMVRREVAKHGKFLEELKNDENEYVRKEAEKQLDINKN